MLRLHTDSSTATNRDLLKSQEGHGDGNDIGGDVTDHLNLGRVLGDELLRHGSVASMNLREIADAMR